MKALSKTLLVATILSIATVAMAGELDNDGQVANQGLQETVVVRIDTHDNSMAVLNTKQVVHSELQAKALTQQTFTAVPATQVRSELDRDGGASSWYVYWYGYSYSYVPTYCYYGHYYNPYYQWRWGSYYYYYYGAYYPWWR
jgi:hypothetical protein